MKATSSILNPVSDGGWNTKRTCWQSEKEGPDKKDVRMETGDGDRRQRTVPCLRSTPCPSVQSFCVKTAKGISRIKPLPDIHQAFLYKKSQLTRRRTLKKRRCQCRFFRRAFSFVPDAVFSPGFFHLCLAPFFFTGLFFICAWCRFFRRTFSYVVNQKNYGEVKESSES